MKKVMNYAFSTYWKKLKVLLLIMRLISFLILVGTLTVSANSYSQQTKLDLRLKNSSIENILLSIENNSRFIFIYDANIINTLGKKTIEAKGQRIETILDHLFEGTEVAYRVDDRQVFLFQKDNLTDPLLSKIRGNQQLIEIRGTINDPDGNPLPGVTVVIKGTTQGTITDIDGNYSLNNVPDDATLVFSFVGMKTQENPVAGKSLINVTMAEDAIGIDEVVAVGYGTMKKRDLTGSVSSVKEDQIKNIPVTTMEQALIGRASGVQITQGGAPGSSATIRIRGISTTGNNDPLWIVDGLPIGGTYNLNPNDVETIDILKDASAAAIYGSRAANGVIIVTTKRGFEGKTKVEIDSYYGFQQVWKQMDLLTGPEFAKLANEAYTNSGRDLNPLWGNPASLPTTDWQDAIFQNGAIQNHNVSISGGTQKLKTAMSLNYHEIEGTVITSKFERYSVRLNTDYEISKKINVGSNLQFSRNSSVGVTTNDMSFGLLNIAVQMHPDQPGYNQDGSYNVLLQSTPGLYYPRQLVNPVASANFVNNKNFGQRFLGSVFGELEIYNGLKFKSTFGLNITNGSTRNFTPFGQTNPADVLNNSFSSIAWSMNEGFSYSVTNLLTYNAILNDKHNIAAVLGSEAIAGSYYGMNTTAQNTPSNEMQVLDAAATSDGRGGGSENAYVSYFGRVNYIYNDKYIFQFNARADGSYKFDPEYRWGYFPSGSVAWRLSGEEFMKSFNFIDNLKLRASYGALGNQNSVSDFAYMSRYQTHNIGYSLGTNDQSIAPAVILANMGNPKLRWESQVMTDIGVDANLWNNSISIVFDYYNKITDGLLVPIPVPATLGAPGNAVVQNAGKIKNSGIELGFDYNAKVRDINFSIGTNFTTINNEVLSLGAGQPIVRNIGLVGGNAMETRTEVGGSIGEYYGYITDGIYQDISEILPGEIAKGAQPGDRKYVNLNNDDVIDSKDRTYLGSPIPKFFYGLNLNVLYKGFDFTVFMQGQHGNKILNRMKGQLYNIRNFNGAGVGNVSKDLLDSWRGEGTSNTLPRVAYAPNWNNYAGSDFYIEDGSFFRCRSLQLGYTIPPHLLSRYHIGNMRIYANVQNLFTITNYSGFDPEISNSNALSSGVDQGQYPVARSFTLGVNLQF